MSEPSVRSVRQQRRGQAEMLEWFPRIILMIVAITVIVLLVRVYTNRDVDSAPISRGAYIYRLYYDDIIMYSDPVTKRVYPGIVDVAKLTPDRLEKLYTTKEPGEQISQISARVAIQSEGGCAISREPIYLDRRTFDDTQHFNGPSGDPRTRQMTTTETAVFPVTLKEGGLECPGTLNITVVRQNS